MGRHKEIPDGAKCHLCPDAAAARWKTKLVCLPCYQRAHRNGKLCAPYEFRRAAAEARRKRVKTLLAKDMSAADIARDLRLNRQTVIRDIERIRDA